MATDLETGSERRSVTRLVSGIFTDAEDLIRQQLTLFRLEMKQDVRRVADAGASILGAAAFLLAGVVLFCFGLVHLLAWLVPQLPLWACFGIVGGVFIALGVCLVLFASSRIRSIHPLSDNAAQAVKETIQWKTIPK
jgi:Putative Actinobacterial Holin-X, holin superfamily III